LTSIRDRLYHFFVRAGMAVDYNQKIGANMSIWKHLVLLRMFAAMVAVTAALAGEEKNMAITIERKICQAEDRVMIVYSACGAGEPALVFIHGGLADRSFWDAQLKAFGGNHRVIALDLAGHGESGANRTKWGLPEFGADVKAVADAEKLKKIILFGNSLGGPVAIEAALLLPGRVLGVVGVDTFQSLDYKTTPDEARSRAEAFQKNYAGSVKTMTRALFHADADPAIMADAERRMAKTSPDAAYGMFLSLAGYDTAGSARRLTVPLRAINGDLYPTDVPGVRKIKPEFEVIIMKHMGHYPMLERPYEFNKHVAAVVAELEKK
jgi:pimeloyl-ACP methyl ester carboxylesterase